MPLGDWIRPQDEKRRNDEIPKNDAKSFQIDVSMNELGNQIGNSMSQNVVERILWSLLPAAGLGDNVSEDRWESGKALQKLRESSNLTFANSSSRQRTVATTSSLVHEFLRYDSSPKYRFNMMPKNKIRTPVGERY